MKMKKILLSCMLAAAVASQAGNVSVADARRAACDFLRQGVASGTMRAAKGISASDLVLAHAEASQAVTEAVDYYAFNVPSGGWVIVAGEDRAKPVLAYSDQGTLNFDQLPCTAQSLLDSYKREIEYLQTYAADDLVPAKAPSNGKTLTVGPLITSTWGQETPYSLQCPIYQNEYCVVGCVATAMAQVMKYWHYPESSGAIPAFISRTIGKRIGALPATTFDYSLLLDSYCHWDWEASTLVQDSYSDAQAQEAAKLSRYCGQAVEMDYSPEGSGAYTWDQLDAMLNFGYRSTADLVERDGYWSSNYTTAQWESMIRAEIDAGRPILYSASDTYGSGGHAFICDGYSSDMFHFNMGWYGTCDGWYASTALNMTHRDGDDLRFNTGHDMIIGLEPPEGWVRPSDFQPGDINGDGNVDVNDLNIIINITLENDSADNYPGDANIDGEGSVDVNDINLLINLILSQQP